LLRNAVSRIVPTVPIVILQRWNNLKFRVGGCASGHHGLPGVKLLGTAWSKDLDVAGTDGDVRLRVIMHGNPICAGMRGANRDVRRIHLDIGIGIAQYSKGGRATR
jgi:hypothetical protein